MIAMLIADIALGGLLGASGTNITLVSETKTEKAWVRNVVMQREDGTFFNDGGAVGSKAAVAAADEAAEEAGDISVAANNAMTQQISRLNAAAVNAATNAIGLALVFPPETSRTNLTMFVAAEETDGLTDTQYVWINREIDLPPNRFVVYRGIDNCATQKCSWVNYATTTNITNNGRTWQGCHKCTITRPSWAQHQPCLTNPNESRFGGPNGFDFGDMMLTMRGVPLVTAVITNKYDAGDVIWFCNGFYMGKLPVEE